jgi:hypothetical protein
MSESEDRNVPIAEAHETEDASSSDVSERTGFSSADSDLVVASQETQSCTVIVEPFIEQPQQPGQDADLPQHMKPAEDAARQPSAELIDKDRLNEILEHARREDIPFALLNRLLDLWGCYPEEIAEPPYARDHALSDVILPFWEQDLGDELMDELLFYLEGDQKTERLWVPQPASEIASPANLYQLVRKARDQNRMEELLAMIEENDYALLGETREEASARHQQAWTNSEEAEEEKLANP